MKWKENDFCSVLATKNVKRTDNCSGKANLTGTVVIHVGFNTDASPLLPRIILLLVSMSVVGVEYPMGTPVNRQTLSANNSKTCANGKNLTIFNGKHIKKTNPFKSKLCQYNVIVLLTQSKCLLDKL